MTYELVEGGRKWHCKKHERTFGKRESCDGCDAERVEIEKQQTQRDASGIAVDDLEEQKAPAPPAGCLSAEEHERKLVEIAEFCEKAARSLVVDENGNRKRGRVNFSTAFKGIELAIKAYSASGEYAKTRERRAHVKRLDRARRALRARRHTGGSN